MAFPSKSPPRRGIWLVRIGLPATIAVVGLAFLAAGSTGLGLTLLGVALVVAFANALVRLGIAGEADRDHEEEARRTFDRTGRWPGER
jgi:hypothetical protein